MLIYWSFNVRLWHTKPEIGGYPQSLSTDHHELYANRTKQYHWKDEDYCQTHACIKGCCGDLRPLRCCSVDKYRDLSACMCTYRAGSEAKEHHYGLNTSKTKHRLSGAPLSARLRLWRNRGRGGRLSLSEREKQQVKAKLKTITENNLLNYCCKVLIDPALAPSLQTHVVWPTVFKTL